MKRRSLRVFLVALLLLALLASLAPAVFASNAYTINGRVVRYDDFTSEPGQCWTYANKVYNKIWDQSFSSDFGSADNALRKMTDDDLRLTAVHLKDYVSKAALGSCIRVCHKANLHSHDGVVDRNVSPGHNLIIVQKDANGFTAFEGGLRGYPAPYCREKYYTWSGFVQEKGYTYIKYIKWPGATAYTPPAPHTCDLNGGYAFVETAHPHYKCYYCSICGVAQRNYSEPTTREDCLECKRPATPALLDMKTTYHPGEAVIFTWKPTANTTHYNIYLDKKGENGEYSRLENVFYAESGLTRTPEEGSYRVRLQSTNKNYYESDGKNWLYKNAEWVEFEVAHTYVPTITAPTCTVNGYTTYTCTGCGDKYVADEVAALGHDLIVDSAVAATCTEDGLTEGSHCSRCDYKVEQQVVAKLGHSYRLGVCARCGEKDPDYRPVEFIDVPTNAWYKEAVDYAVGNGLMNGVGGGRFAPEDSMTRAMLVTVLWRYAGSPTEGTNRFSDVPGGQWYTAAVAWAAGKGVVNGTSATTFEPDGNITREQMAAILYRYANSVGIDTSARQDFGGFPDSGSVSGYARDALSWCIARGIINGSNECGVTYLLPQGNATRAQVATIFMRFLQNVVE